jgi:hypothetical protein
MNTAFSYRKPSEVAIVCPVEEFAALVLAELRGDITLRLEQLGNGRIIFFPGSFARVLLRHFLDLRHDLNEVVGLRVLQRRERYV